MKICTGFLGMLKVSRLFLLGGSMSLATVSVNALTLQDAIEDMLANNPDVQSARQEMLAREHEIRGAKAAYLPTLNAEAGVGREWTRSRSTGFTGTTLTREEAALRLRQVVFDGNATGAEVDRQKARFKSALFTAIDTQENAALRARKPILMCCVKLNCYRYLSNH